MRVADLMELDWEVGVFKALRGLARMVRPPAAPWDEARAAKLDGLATSLGHLASLVAEEPMKVLPSRGAGGVRGREILLPVAIDAGPDAEVNRGLYVLRTVHAATIRRLGLDRLPLPADALDLARLEARIAQEAAEAAALELAAFSGAWAEACQLCLDGRRLDPELAGVPAAVEGIRRAALRAGAGRGDVSGADARVASAKSRGESAPVPLWGQPLPSVAADGGGAGASPGRKSGAEHDAPPVDAIRRVTLDEKVADEQVLQHTFEKVETIEAFNGVVRKLDGADDLDGELEALEEAGVGDLFRGGPEAHAVLRAELGNADVPDVGELEVAGIPYDEWDVRKRDWRRGWCHVYPRPVAARDPAWTQAATQRLRPTIANLRAVLERQLAARAMLPRQADGDDIDIDALVDAQALYLLGREEPRIYQRSARVRRDFACLVLLDISLSSDAWVGNRRVLDVCRDAVFVMGEVANTLGDTFAIHAFSSVTRHRCDVAPVKTWDDRWLAVRDRLGAIEPQGYTRIGAALRHATALLAARRERRKLLVLLSDGRPTDYDRYEGSYGLADVRMALRQAENSGITSHALAVTTDAGESLSALFGVGGWELLPNPDRLPDALGRVYGQWR